jgi:hypothetical protein
MGIIGRGIVFVVGTISNAILFLFHSRVILEVLSVADDFASGPADGAFAILPVAIQLAIGGIQVGLVLYFIGGLGQERTADRRPMP